MPSGPKLRTTATVAISTPQLQRAADIFAYAHESASALVKAFAAAKLARGNPRGVLTDQEQDILRAALVMACAGLDATLKQAIRDCLEMLLTLQPKVRDGFEKFIRQRLDGSDGSDDGTVRTKFLATVLAESSPRMRLIEEYIRELTGDSLQSWDELARTVGALGLEVKTIGLDKAKLQGIFAIRNKIIHELDMELSTRVRKRKLRSQADLLDNGDYVLKSTKLVLEHLDRACKSHAPPH